MDNQDKNNLPRYAFSPTDAAVVSGLGRTRIYSFIKRGLLKSHKAGGRTVILAEDLKEFLQGLPDSREAA